MMTEDYLNFGGGLTQCNIQIMYLRNEHLKPIILLTHVTLINSIKHF